MDLERFIALLIHGEKIPNQVLVDMLSYIRAQLLVAEDRGSADASLAILDEMARHYLDDPH